MDPAGHTERLFVGDCRGTLADAARGERGFGYDPAFLPVGRYGGRTMAELSDAEKDAISHRGAAVAELLRWPDADRLTVAGTPAAAPRMAVR